MRWLSISFRFLKLCIRSRSILLVYNYYEMHSTGKVRSSPSRTLEILPSPGLISSIKWPNFLLIGLIGRNSLLTGLIMFYYCGFYLSTARYPLEFPIKFLYQMKTISYQNKFKARLIARLSFMMAHSLVSYRWMFFS